jgi:hypothetical protein
VSACAHDAACTATRCERRSPTAALTCAGGDLNIVVFEVILQNVMAVKASYAAPGLSRSSRVATASAPDFFTRTIF